jgi:multidrug efflux pump subunit AcrA (membrane-fusion protein)
MHQRQGANSEELAEAQTSVALARAELAEAREAVRAAKIRVQESAARLEQHTLRAPFDGVVLRRHTDVGAVLRTGDPIVEFAAIDRVRVDLYLPASVAMGVDVGAAYSLALEAPVGRIVWARARYVEPRIEPTSNTIRVVFDFETPEGRIPAGLLVTPADRVPNAQELAFMSGVSNVSTLATVGDDSER